MLLLEDGTVFHGMSAGKIGSTTGEICFNTGMTGYQEIFTDPSYFGQILVTTNVHIGNYGTFTQDNESSSVKINGLVCRNFTNLFSRAAADESIQEFLLNQNIIAISDVDTRAIVKHIRDKGAMNGIISSDISDVNKLKERLQKVPSMKGLELASKVSTEEAYVRGDENSQHRVAVYDLGVKRTILECFEERGCYLKVFPAKTPIVEVLEWQPNGIFLSNGPGDPEPMTYAVDAARKVLELDIPLFGICLGHQILAQAVGIPTYKMHHGHHGANHPVKNLVTGKGEITTQNHGFGVAPDAIEKHQDKVKITHVNLNDQTIEGIEIIGKKAFSVQYHPESSPGPHDSRYLFDQFIALLN